MTTARSCGSVAIACVSLFFLAGCSNTKQDLQAERAKYLLNEEPSGLLGVLEAREIESPDEIVVFGRVGSKSHETWEPGKAAFVITDTTVEITHDHGDGDHSDCPWCKLDQGKGPDPSAIVQILDESKNILPIDAQELLGVKEGQIVVVKGDGHVDKKLGLFYVAASGVYIRE